MTCYEIRIETRTGRKISHAHFRSRDRAQRTMMAVVHRYNLDRLRPGRASMQRWGSDVHEHIISMREVEHEPSNDNRIRQTARAVFGEQALERMGA